MQAFASAGRVSHVAQSRQACSIISRKDGFAHVFQEDLRSIPRELPDVERATLGRIFLSGGRTAGTRRWSFFPITCAALLGALPSFIKRIVDRAIPERNMTRCCSCCAWDGGGAPARRAARRRSEVPLGVHRRTRHATDLRVQLFRHVQRQSLGYFASAKPGEVVSRVLNDVHGRRPDDYCDAVKLAAPAERDRPRHDDPQFHLHARLGAGAWWRSAS